MAYFNLFDLNSEQADQDLIIMRHGKWGDLWYIDDSQEE